MLHGIDISNHNAGANKVNLDRVYEWIDEADFVWIRATEGNQYPDEPSGNSVDPYRLTYVHRAKAGRKGIGLYHFAHLENNPEDDARWFAQYGGVQDADRLAVDVEPEDAVDWHKAADWIMRFEAELHKHVDKQLLLYMYDSQIKALMNASTQVQQAALRTLYLWKALWTEEANGYGDDYGFTVACWQHSGGEPGDEVDRDVWLSDDWATVGQEEDDMPRTTSNGWPWLEEFTGAQFVAIPNDGKAHDVVDDDAVALFSELFYRLGTEVFAEHGGLQWCSGARTWAQQQATNPLVDDTNHGSGTACDGGDDREHPYEPTLDGPYYSGFSASEERQIRQICRDLDVMQWGGDFPDDWRDPGHYQYEQDLSDLSSHRRVISAAAAHRAANKSRRRVRKIQKAVGAKQDGIAGPGTLDAVRKWQRDNGLKDDGVFGPKSQEKAGWEVHKNPGGKVVMLGDTGAEVKAVQRKVGVRADGVFGPTTQRAVKRTQNLLHVEADGQWGPASERAYDAFVDGELGEKTIKVWQQVLGVARDGDIGPQTIKAIQHRLGITEDGVLGPQTKRAVQRHLRVTADGIWGNNTIRALQKRLLQGRF